MAIVTEVYEFGLSDERIDYRYFLENLLNILSTSDDREFHVAKLGNYYSAEEWLSGSADTGECYIVNHNGIFKISGYDSEEQQPAMTEFCNFYDTDKLYKLVDHFRKHRLRVLFTKKEVDVSPDDEIPFDEETPFGD